MWSNQPEIRVFSGFCPDEACQTKLFFPSYAASSIECTGCGKHFHKEALTSVQLIQDSEEAIRSLLRSVLLTGTALKKGTDLVKVKGYSNYHCRILSPILTYYGMDKSTSKAKLLQEMGQGEAFDCAHVGDRAFSIEPEYLETPGYGKDKSGSTNYLHGLLEEIKLVNDNEERLVSLHVDGDGHCLVHAISRALIGREIFWHALMTNLQKHLKDNICKYRTLFMDFIGREEWDLIISEAGPDFEPQDDQPLGLRNIHIFGLANVLHRPILLLDSVSGIQSSADYSGTFLPALVPVDLCKTKDGKRIPPLAIAWSNSGRNHYIPLVNVRNKPAARVPSWVIPKAWGIPNELVKAYIDFETTDVCVIGGTKSMSDAYLDRLLTAMDEKFLEINHISASLVTEVHQFVFKPSGVVGVRPKTVIDRTRQTVEASLLLRCLSCTAVSEYLCPVDLGWLVPGGRMYVSASQVQGRLSVGEMYSFPEHSVVCTYNADNDVLEVTKYKGADVTECVLCKGSLRNVKPDGSLIYRNGDRTTTPVSGIARCLCGYKHFWDGKEYNNQPEIFPVSLDWGGTAIKENVYWFQYETDPSLNSNVYAVAQKLVQKYYPGEFGSERLVQKVVDTILRQTAKKEGENKGDYDELILVWISNVIIINLSAHPDIPNLGASSSNAEDSAVNLFIPSKIILTGQKKKTFHKEELTKSDAERRVQIKTEHNAQLTQNRQSRRQKTPEKSPAKTQVQK
ncbi:hypothetical protein QZH41_018987 [Actinostola sp. cb2023]|nr:hypothetical protein QZH41_018987 [Actinostola sp. cb2023]